MTLPIHLKTAVALWLHIIDSYWASLEKKKKKENSLQVSKVKKIKVTYTGLNPTWRLAFLISPLCITCLKDKPMNHWYCHYEGDMIKQINWDISSFFVVWEAMFDSTTKQKFNIQVQIMQESSWDRD